MADLRVTQGVRQVVYKSDPESFRVTQAIRQVVLKSDPESFRVTQAIRQVVLKSDPESFRVTQAIRQVAYLSERPYRPSIVSVTDLTTATATVLSSDYYHPGGDAHEGTRYQVRLAGALNWESLVYDTGWLGAVVTAPIIGMSALTSYQVRVQYRDVDLDLSDWSHPYTFMTTQEAVEPGDFDWDDWGQMWNIGKAYYSGSYIGAGGWDGPLSWFMWDAGGGGGGDYNCLGAGDTIASGFNGHVGSFGRLMGPPSVLANTDMGPNNGVNVAGKVSWYSSESGFQWEAYWDCEYARAGVAALVCGTCEPLDPSLGHNFWGRYTLGQWPCTDEMQGVVAFIEPRWSYPFVACRCCPGRNIADKTNPLLTLCKNYGISMSQVLRVVVYMEGKVVKNYSYDLPFNITFNSLDAFCSYQCDPNYMGQYAGRWMCRHFPKYGIRLKVWHDYAADPTGKTHRFQAAATSPLIGHSSTGGSQGSVPLVTGRWGTQDATLPPENGPWDIDETWVGGNEESTPGAEDGGLYAGWTGWVSDRWTGAKPSRTTGGNIYLDFVATPLDLTHCDTPCEAHSEPPVPVTPESDPQEMHPFLSPCPPDQDTADKELYLGGRASPGSLFKFGGYEVEEGRQLIATIHPNTISPAGVEGVCHFKSLFVVCEHISDIQIGIVPILNGERLDQYAQEEVFIGPGDRSALQRYEMPLYRQFEDEVVEGAEDNLHTHGLRGTFFTFEMTVVDLCGVGLQLPGVWLDYEIVQEDQNTGVVYTQVLLRAPLFTPTNQVFMGTKGYNRVLKAESGVTDDGVAVQARSFCNPVAPAGAAGECHFKALSLTVTRWNANAMDMVFQPFLDGNPLGPITINFKATTGPVVEVVEIDLSQAFRHDGADATDVMMTGMRGAWFSGKLETGSGLQEWLSIEGGSLDFDIVRESLQKDVR